MHELGTVNYVINQVEKVCEDNSLSYVGSVTLTIGEVSGIIPEYIVRYWNWAKKKTEYLADAELRIEELKAETFCEDCGKVYPTVQYGKICPHCGSPDTYLLRGNEYMIKEIEAM